MGQTSTQGHITIKRQRNGKDGDDSIRRYLVISPTALITDSGKTAFEGGNTIHCEVWSQEGGKNPTQNGLSDASVAIYKDNGTTPVATRTGTSFDYTGAVASASSYTFKLMYGGACVDAVTVPVYQRGQNAVRLDLDNETDVMLYDEKGSRLGGELVCNARLYEGMNLVNLSGSTTIKAEATGCTLSGTTNNTSYFTVKVSALSSDSASVLITAKYQGKDYTAKWTIKKLVGKDKYEIVTNPTAVKYDPNSKSFSSNIIVDVYRTTQNGERKKLTSSDTGFSLGYSLDKGGSWTSMNPSGTIPSSSFGSATQVDIKCINGSTVFDYETVPIVTTGINGTNGKDGTSVMAQYSANGSSWHSSFQSGDVYMRTSSDGGKTWTSAIRIIGEKGIPGMDGSDGSYMEYSFAISSQKTTANPTTAPSISGSWSDGPVATTSSYPYLWCRTVFVSSTGTRGTAKYFRVTGEQGPQGRPGEDGIDGKDAISIQLSANAISAKYHDGTAVQTFVSIVDVYVGLTHIPASDFEITATPTPTDLLGAGTATAGDYSRQVLVYVKDGKYGSGNVSVAIKYKGVTYTKSISVSVSDINTVIRGPLDWVNVSSGFQFMSGKNGERFLDIVFYGEKMYECRVSHVKSTTLPSVDTTHWREADNLPFVATKLFLASKALINNLQVNDVYIADVSGNILLVANKQGITCNKGVFNNVEVSGTLKGVTGSFVSLECVNSKGKSVGRIRFSSESGITFEDGDLRHQGTNSSENRDLRFYSQDIWCRGMFGARERAIIEVTGRTGRYYDKGYEKTPTSVSLESGTYNNETYYKIPCYGQSGDYAGMPVDIVVFKINVGAVYRYELEMSETQRVLVVNANDDNNNVYIYSHGNKVQFGGGQLAEVVKLPSFARPTQETTILGRGLFVGSLRDNDW